MPRNVKESDDEFEPKSGRRTRMALSSSVLDSPLRRSTRIKQPVVQNDSSPESHSDVSSVGSRSVRRRTTAFDGTIPETTRNLRARRNSAASDISELADNDLPTEMAKKRMTRRSLANPPSAETPTKFLAKTRRATRAGSETISTPPVGRVTRRTRASSMEPEATEELKNLEIGTPSKSKRRASALPSEPAVAEESEEIRIEQTVFEIDEDELESSLNVSKSRRKSKGDTSEEFEKMEVDETPESEVETIERSFREKTSSSGPNVPKTLGDSTIVLDSSGNIENFENSLKHQKSTETQENISVSDENEISNTSVESSLKNNTSTNTEVRSSPRISLSSLSSRISEKRSSVSREPETASLHEETKTATKFQHNVANDFSITDKILSKKDYTLDTECIVVIEPMNVEITNGKFDLSKNQVAEKPQKFNVEREHFSKINEDNKENEETTNEVVPGMKNVTSVTLKDSNDAKDEDENEKIAELDDLPKDHCDAQEKMTSDDIDEKSSMDRSIEEENPLRESSSTDEEKFDKSNDEEIIVSDETSKPSNENSSKHDEEISSCGITSPGIKIMSRRFSLEMKTPSKSEEKEGEIICKMVKDRKSSIVTESSSGDTNMEESSGFNEPEVTEESLTNGITSKTRKQEDSIEITKKINENDEFRVSESENESEIIDCPSFKDIPADEWIDRDENEETTRDKIIDEDSIHSFSTERNESECDIALVDKELSQPPEIDRQVKITENVNYDSDDTIIERIEKNIKNTDNEKQKIDEEMSNENASMDVSVNDIEEDKKTTNSSTKKRSSLSDSLKLANKNDEESNDENDFSIRSNTSRRKSLPNLNNESKKSTSNSEDASRKSLNLSRKTRRTNSLTHELIDSDHNEMDIDVEEMKNSSKAELTLRTSLNASVKRSSNASILDTGKTKKRQSLNKSRVDSPDPKIESEDSADRKKTSDDENSGNKADENESRDNEEIINECKRKSVNNRNESKIEDDRSNSEIVEDDDSGQKLNASSRIKRKSVKSRRASKIERSSSDSETEENENLVEKLNQSSKSTSSRKSLNKKNTSMRNEESSSSEIEEEATKSDSEENENSPKILNESKKSLNDRKSLNISDNSSARNVESENDDGFQPNESKRKSLNDRNKSMIEDEKSSSEIEENDDSRKKLNASSRSNRKSVNSRNASKIERSSSDSKSEDSEDSVKKLNQSSKSSSSRKSINRKNKSMREEENSSSENVEDARKSDSKENENCPERLNRSKRSSSKRKSLNGKNNSKIEKEDSDSEIEVVALQSNLDRSKKSMRKSPNGRNNSRTERNDSNSIIEISNSRSIEAAIDADSDNDETSSTENDEESALKIPQFLYNVNTSSDESDDSDKSIDSEIANEMNLAGKSIIEYSDDDVPGDDCMATESESCDSEDDDGKDLEDFVVNDDEYESSESMETELDDNDESLKTMNKTKEKKRKRIIPRSARDSDSPDSDEETKENSPSVQISLSDEDPKKTGKTPKKDENASKEKSLIIVSPDKLKSVLTPKSDKQQSESITMMEVEKTIDTNKRNEGSLKKTKETLLDSSTPNISPRKTLSTEKSNSAKSKKFTKIDNSAAKLDTSISEAIDTPKKLTASFKEGKSPITSKTPKSSKIDNSPTKFDTSISEVADTPTKLTTSFKESKSSITPKTPKLSKSPKSQTKIIEDSNDSDISTILTKVKLEKKSSLNRTMTTPNTDSPETRFLMKERLNDTLPALKLQQRTKQLRRSVLDNVPELAATSENNRVSEGNIATTEENDIPVDIIVTDVDKTKKKKKKKKVTGDDSIIDVSDELIVETKNESISIVEESPELRSTDEGTKKSKKRKRNKKNSESMEVEELSINETEKIPTKKKKRKNKESKLQEEVIENIEIIETNEKEKKKKKKKKKDAGSNLEEEIAEDQKIPKEKKQKKKKKDAGSNLAEEIVEDQEITEIKKKKKKRSRVQVSDLENTISGKNLSVAPNEIDSSNGDRESTSLIESRKLEKNTSGEKSTKREKSINVEQTKKIKSSSSVTGNEEKLSSSVKRLSDDFLESLTEISERPKKRRKIVKEEKILPSKSMFNLNGKTSKNIEVNNDFISLSSSGGTTQFGVVDLEKVRKKPKKSVAAKSFRERMLARNPRQPISAYLMYQQKQKVSGKNQLH